ncbi:MAG TPA: hypothetical protein VIK64_03995, partial [Anaerolineales bacterium]
QEAVDLSGEARREFLRTVAAGRMYRLAALCDALGRPWTEVLSGETTIEEDWYRQYPGIT